MKQIFHIQGMHCASCATIITTKVSKLDGVFSCEVNFATHTVSLEWDEARVGIPTIANEIKKYGYTLVVPKSIQEGSSLSPERTDEDELKKAKNAMLISLPFVTISLLFMVWMIGKDYGRRPGSDIIYEFFHHLLPIIATIMLFLIGWKYVVAVGKYIKYGVANMDTLVGIGSLIGFLYSFLVSAFEDSGLLDGIVDTTRYFYETIIVVIGFISIGKYLEIKVMSKTGKAIKTLLGLQSKEALLLKDGKEVLVPLEKVAIGDIMIVKPGEKIPLDGEIMFGQADIDEAMITGESLPVLKTLGDEVIGSTIVTNSMIHVKATAIGKNTYLAKIIAIVSEAQNSKPQIQKLVDTIMGWFIPVVLVVAVLSGAFWYFFGDSFFPEITPIQFALMSFIGVLVIACPCGLGLATPMAIIAGIGHGAKNGILAKNAEGLLKLRKTSIVVFDKTGTITLGKPTLVDQKVLSGTEYENFSLLASLEASSSHPIAHALVSHAKEHALSVVDVKNFKNLEGVGVQGEIDGTLYVVSKPSYLETKHISYDKQLIEERTKQGKTPLVLSTSKKILGYYAVADTIKQTSKQAILDLKKQGIIPIMLTGDHNNTAKYIASQVGINRVYAEVKPEEKAKIILELKKEGIVAMVGDGINDAPALATADVGIAMSTGTDVAIESADLILLHGDISKLVKAFTISHFTQNAIRQNLIWAFGFNVIGIPLAAGVFYPFLGVLLNPAFEGAAMAFSSLTVVGNSLRLQNKKIGSGTKGLWEGRIIGICFVVLVGVGLSFLFSNMKKVWDDPMSSLKIQISAGLQTDINTYLINTPNKIAFAPGGVPKIFVGSDQLVPSLNIAEGTGVFTTGGSSAEMIIGFKEAAMMKEEKLIKNAGDSLTNFFGLPTVKIVGILAPTNTFLDEVHIINGQGFSGLNATDSIYITQTPLDELKLFYFYDENTIPTLLQNTINPKKPIYTLKDKEYTALYIGSDEAKMMKKESLFTNKYDTINDFFGNDVIIAGVLEKTSTVFDMMHLVPREAWKK